jgi:hypothetical protein
VKGAEDEEVQVVTRPSEFVVAVKERGELEEEEEKEGVCLVVGVSMDGSFGRSEVGGAYNVSVTGMLLAGFPIVVSRTWHVIGGFFSVAMVFATISGFGELERWFERASTR